MRATLGLLTGVLAPVLALGAFADAQDYSEADQPISVTSAEEKMTAVFPVPSEEQLAKITHRELRTELLRMVHEDQFARSASK